MSNARHNTRKTNFYRAYRMLQKTMMLSLFVCLGNTVFAQPINDEPAGAIFIDVQDSHEYLQFSNDIATHSEGPTTPPCGSYSGGDIWFKMVVPNTGSMKVRLKTEINPKVVMSVYTGTPDSLTHYKCAEDAPNEYVSSMLKIIDSDLIGETVYLRVFRYGANTGGTFGLSAFRFDEAVPENNHPEEAIVLNDKACIFEFQTFTTESSTATEGYEEPSCGKYKGGDVWFRAEVPMSGKLIIETNPVDVTPVVVVYNISQEEVATGNFDNLETYDCSFSGLRDEGGEVIIDDPDLAGEEIMIQVFANNYKWGGTFDIVVLEPRLDVCSDAIELKDISATEKYVPYTNQYANENGTEPTCGPFMGKDIWFVVKVPENGELEIDTKVDENYDVKPVLTAYTGTCGNLTQYACNYFGSENPFGAKLDINDPNLANEYIYVRMYAFNDAIGGAFQMSTRQPNPSSLPVELLSFRSQIVNNEAVVLTWETATELNNDYFIVEHSIDGKEYTPVGHITGNGTTNEIQYYTFEHDKPYFGENYYRLKQVDFDGQFEYSHIVMGIIKMEEAKVNVYPNPVVASRGINIRWIGDFGRENIQLIISNTSGKQVFLTQVDVRYERESFIDLSNLGLNAGIYYLTVNDENALIANQKINLVRD